MSTVKRIKETIYYVSNLGNNTITAIDGEVNAIIRTINLPYKPFRISANKNGDIYVGSDKNPVAVICNLNDEIKILDILSNGNLEIDVVNGQIYISNTSEILVYDIFTERKIARVLGFMVIESLKLDSNGKHLVVLDSLRKDLKIYDTSNFKLLTRIKNVGIKPSYILINDDSKFIYVANQGGKAKNSASISIIDIEKKEVFQIELPTNSSITSLALKDNILYGANKGLNRVEIINITTNILEGFIATTLPEPQSILLTPNKDKLLVTDRNCGGQGALDIIDTATNAIVNTILIEEINSQPYDITMVLNESLIENENAIDSTNMEEKKDEVELSPIIVKKIFSSYKEDISLPKVIVNIPKTYREPFTFQKIIIHNGFIVNRTEIREKIKERPNFSKVKFTLRIPYNIEFRDGKRKKKRIKRFVEKNEEVTLCIPDSIETSELELVVKTRSEIRKAPILVKDAFCFSLDVFMEIKVVGEVEALVNLSEL